MQFYELPGNESNIAPTTMQTAMTHESMQKRSNVKSRQGDFSS